MSQAFTLPIQWNANPDQVLGDFTPVPTAWYPGAVVEMEYKEKKDKPGEGYVQLVFEIDEGEFKGRQMFDNVNLWDTGEKIQQFVQRKVNTLCVATGQHQLTDLNQIMYKRMLAHIKLQDGREVKDENTGEVKKYEPRNQIANYKALTAAAPATTGVPANFGQPPAQAQAQQSTQAPPVANQAPATSQPATPAVAQQTSAPAAQAGPAVAAGSVPPWVKQ